MGYLTSLLLSFCLLVSTAPAQVRPQQPLTPPPSRNIDQSQVEERQHLVQELCMQHGRIKALLPAATMARLAPAIPRVKQTWLSRPADPEVIAVARGEVRRIFGTPDQHVESILVGYLFGEAIDCVSLERDPATRGEAHLKTTIERSDQRANQLISILSSLLKLEKDTESSVIRKIG